MAVALLQACGAPSPGDDAGTGSDTAMSTSIEQVLEAHTATWMALPGVEGTGIGRCDGTPCIKVFVRSITDTIAASIPDEVEGHPIRLEPTGGFEAREPPDDGEAEGS